ncbi:pyrroline-5-carboxylate reductase [Flavobacterium sp. '19STA2R22 D10 B1']|uniref:pyrroline-5-carboxylate reductase n=1 Tax=Flavobacterium aerium TaxID=3037261 RepID=UPI00278C5F49|nr:pyrroline-5-carboxylate reductase [Flavobacterium sp. '19STA2R22 D10 B1']
MKIAIIGGGNLGTSIALGIAKFTEGNEITVTRRNLEAIRYLEESNILLSSDNTTAVQEADVVILTVKPYQVTSIITALQPYLKNKIVASAVSGLTMEHLQEQLDQTTIAMRIMPNIAIQFGTSATCVTIRTENHMVAEPFLSILDQLGSVVLIEEKMMDAATVLGACGTAYALRYIRAAMQAGIEIGFDAQTALAIASQTVKGAAEMALQEKVHPEQLIDRVTTPKGCTIVGLNEMEHQGFSSSLIKGIKTSLENIKG